MGVMTIYYIQGLWHIEALWQYFAQYFAVTSVSIHASYLNDKINLVTVGGRLVHLDTDQRIPPVFMFSSTTPWRLASHSDPQGRTFKGSGGRTCALGLAATSTSRLVLLNSSPAGLSHSFVLFVSNWYLSTRIWTLNPSCSCFLFFFLPTGFFHFLTLSPSILLSLLENLSNMINAIFPLSIIFC